MVALLGVQIELVQKQLLNLIPSLLYGRYWGLVDATTIALMACEAWSSDMMNKIFGLLLGLLTKYSD